MQTIQWKNGDIYFDSNGKSTLITGEAKLAQDLAFYLLEALAEHKKTKAEVNLAVMGAVAKLRRDQVNKDISDEEALGEVNELTIFTDEEDPTSVYLYLSVSNVAGQNLDKLFDANNKTDLSHLLD